jgi:hypothetical protein
VKVIAARVLQDGPLSIAVECSTGSVYLKNRAPNFKLHSI